METNSLPTVEKKQPKLRWYQWRLWSLFLLTLLVAIGISYVAVTIQDGRKQKAAAEAIETVGGMVQSEPTWLGKLLRNDSLVRVIKVNLSVHPSLKSITDAELVHLQGLGQLQELCLDSTKVTDAGLVHLQGLSQLKKLWLYNTKVTDQGIKKLQQALPNCQISR